MLQKIQRKAFPNEQFLKIPLGEGVGKKSAGYTVTLFLNLLVNFKNL